MSQRPHIMVVEARFYDDIAVRTADGWRLSSVTLTATHQENAGLRDVVARHGG